MANTVTSLADGQLSAAQATLYTCPTGKSAIVGNFTYVNTDASARAVNAWILRSGSTARRIMPMAMTLGVGSAAMICDEENKIYLAAGDEIQGSADAANVVDYTIMGVERDV